MRRGADWDAVWVALFARTAFDNIGRIDWTRHYPWLFNEVCKKGKREKRNERLNGKK